MAGQIVYSLDLLMCLILKEKGISKISFGLKILSTVYIIKGAQEPITWNRFNCHIFVLRRFHRPVYF